MPLLSLERKSSRLSMGTLFDTVRLSEYFLFHQGFVWEKFDKRKRFFAFEVFRFHFNASMELIWKNLSFSSFEWGTYFERFFQTLEVPNTLTADPWRKRFCTNEIKTRAAYAVKESA